MVAADDAYAKASSFRELAFVAVGEPIFLGAVPMEQTVRPQYPRLGLVVAPASPGRIR